MPKWLVQALHDSSLATSLPNCTCFGSQHASYAHDFYAFVSANMCDEEEPISFEEAQNSKFWICM